MRTLLNECYKGVQRRVRKALAGVGLLMAATHQALAALPTAVNPSTGDPGGNWLELVKGYIKDGAIVLGLALSAIAFLWIAWTIVAKFNEARSSDRVEWGELGLVAIAGGAVLLIITFLLTQSSGVID